MKMCDGVEPDGILYEIVLDPDGKSWRAMAWWGEDAQLTRGLPPLLVSEKFRCTHAPVCGPDAFDVTEGNVVLERLIVKLRSTLGKSGVISD